MKSIYIKNFLATAAMIGLCLLLLATSILGIGQSYVVERYRANMLNSAEEVAHISSALSEDETLNSWVLGMALSTISKSTGNHIFVTDENGVAVCCCDEAPICRHIGMTVTDNVTKAIRKDGCFIGKSSLGGFYYEERVLVGTGIYDSDTDELIGYVMVSSTQQNIFSSWKTLLIVLAVVACGVFACILLFAFIYSKRMAKPLDEIAEVSRMFARGDFSARVRQTGDVSDEMGSLIDSFNKMADSLENAEKRRTEFISNVSHELRTPMTTISGFADGILDGTISKEDEEKYLISIRDETRRLARLVRTMLDASRQKSVDPAKRTVFDLTELVLQTLLSFETRATEKNLDVDPQLPDNRLMVIADKDGITQVIYNLLDNAVKFAATGSCITLRLYKDAQKAYFLVRDEGETIPPDDLPYIFDRFHKSDRSRSIDKDGVGLGLYLVKTIINNHDEDIAVKSENGVTEFVFSLALAET